MKVLLPLTAILFFTLPAQECKQKKETEKPLRAKLEIKAMCMNYTLRLVDGNLDNSQIESSWTDETTGKSYKNVFALANPCDFPSSIKEGDEFNFIIVTAKEKNCAVCMAYYPTPKKKLMIKVLP